MRNTVAPCPTTGLLIGDCSYEEFTDHAVACLQDVIDHLQSGRVAEYRAREAAGYEALALADIVWDKIEARFEELRTDVWECDKCGRLYVNDANAESDRFTAYTPDDDVPAVPVLSVTAPSRIEADET